ncbi:hypothetical protein [Algoriphagus pacificus]|uniref:Lipocalin-like domain-containing protein n=1 Tax=Algoriphagus pacificus TaxID=2811234 RepID=A0ABS3CIG2_9BACT|nr:hypothetical protein [Algoriphagus pacificus]MBN7816883.1 hypothetical protein [Algoriphagus pacificus]
MKISFNLILLIFLFNNRTCSQNIKKDLIGHWLYIGTEEIKKEEIECPDLLVLNKNGNYSILNDCYGSEIENPIVEQGQWTFDSKENIILLTNRKFFGDYMFHDSIPILQLYVKVSTGKLLKICFDRKECVLEKYENIF